MSKIKEQTITINYHDNTNCAIYSNKRILIGKLAVAYYGYDYSSSSESKKYCAYSRLPIIKDTKWLFDTEDEARKFAIKIAERVAAQLCM